MDQSADKNTILTTLTLTVEDADQGKRLDAYIATHGNGLSRNRYKAMIKAGHTQIDGRTVEEPNYRVNAGEVITLDVPEAEEADPIAQNIPLTIVHEDEHLIVIDKPAGMVVHPAAGNWTGTLVNALLFHCGASLSGVGGVKRPGIVHRLDKETSGLLVVAKNDLAHKGLAEQFADHGRTGPLERAYKALVWGGSDRRRGTIDANLARSQNNRLKITVVKPDQGRHAVTHFTVDERFPANTIEPEVSLVECRLETGRTHQIRVHMAHIGHPLLGDPEYGKGYQTKAARLPEDVRRAVEKFPRQALHAFLLAFEHPVTGETLRFESQLPKDMTRLISALKRLNNPA